MLNTEMDFQQESWVQATFIADVFLAYRGSFNDTLNPCSTSFTDPQGSKVCHEIFSVNGLRVYAGRLNVLEIKSNDSFSIFTGVEVC